MQPPKQATTYKPVPSPQDKHQAPLAARVCRALYKTKYDTVLVRRPNLGSERCGRLSWICLFGAKRTMNARGLPKTSTGPFGTTSYQRVVWTRGAPMFQELHAHETSKGEIMTNSYGRNAVDKGCAYQNWDGLLNRASTSYLGHHRFFDGEKRRTVSSGNQKTCIHDNTYQRRKVPVSPTLPHNSFQQGKSCSLATAPGPHSGRRFHAFCFERNDSKAQGLVQAVIGPISHLGVGRSSMVARMQNV